MSVSHFETSRGNQRQQQQQKSVSSFVTPPYHPTPPPQSGGTMASIREQERQLFEKFWEGTFKAVAMPRPESIIMASITAGRTLTKSEASISLPPKVSERTVESKETATVAKHQNGRAKKRGRKHRSHHRTRSVSFDGDLSPRPKRKKKKKKSERKRRRERAPSCSPSPVRRKKKKKKKKKSSRKRKQHRTASKKRKHSSSTPKHKRKEDRKHKKRSRSHTHRRRRHARSGAEGSTWNISSSDSRQHLHASDPFQPNPAGLGDTRHLDANQRALDWGTAVKLASKTSPHFSCSTSDSTISRSKPGGEVVHDGSVLHNTLSNQNKIPQDYDSGNDTSSPPSSKTGVSRSNVCRVQSVLGRVDGDSASDSGNSVTSYVSLCKLAKSTSSSLCNTKKEERSAVWKEATRVFSSSLTPLRECHRTRSLRSASRSPSSASSRFSGSYYSRSLSRSSGRRSYSRSSGYSVDSREGSVFSGRLSKYSPSRDQERSKERSPSEKRCKHGKKRRRRKSYSPMRKRRRDSPSHLEARRITSARKRPIPYFRPSLSSCSRSTSVSSLTSFFGITRNTSRSRSRSDSHSCSRSRSRSRRRSWTRSRSRSRSRSRNRSRSRSRSRSCSYSSYRSYSRSSSWDSMRGSRSRSRTRSRTRSRSRSYDSLGSYNRGRR